MEKINLEQEEQLINDLDQWLEYCRFLEANYDIDTILNYYESCERIKGNHYIVAEANRRCEMWIRKLARALK